MNNSCNICDKKFSRSDNLKRHRLHVHGTSLTSVDTNNDKPSNKKTVENETQAGVQPQQFSSSMASMQK